MRAAYYDTTGPATEVLRVGELPDPQPGPGEVLVRVTLSGVNPGDTKKRAGWTGAPMPYPRVVPHSDAAGVVEAVGAGVAPSRVGRRVWVRGAQSYRAGGTAAELTAVPERLATDLPDTVGDVLAACLGIPGVTAHRAVFGDGPVSGRTVLVHGVLGGVGSLAAQLAVWGGARVLGTVRSGADLAEVALPGVTVFALDRPGVAEPVRTAAGGGVDRVVEVSFSDNLDLDAAVLRNGGVLAAYGTRDARPVLDFWPLLFANTTIRLLGSDDFPADAVDAAVQDLTTAAESGAIAVPDADVLPLERVAEAHDRIDAGTRRRQLVAPSPQT
ncbi:NADPH:quinone reductase [Klenkia taihuensis]|uniref:NADPH2:quinone reductase n=1 Tax=Klenkia taihuensis TaxID=1225127 RepID=A0A1I1UAL4_9ACTN|nr:NADPH:quinone reductase [Klenkia taihuensis]GHE06968.1 alcohol dehydrogenase [Klenkia taihuensis]SFD64970.1 NADPH2:quinone reductase [Klenkia taihuensis]